MYDPDNRILTDCDIREAIQHNCDISDARDHGIYSMCSMVLKLRNFYKWEQRLEPWQEPDAPHLLDWIDRKEDSWERLEADSFESLKMGDAALPPFEVEAVNGALEGTGLHYGAGYGRSLKAVFFLAETRDRIEVEGCPVHILDAELARELAAPFAMAQNGRIIIRLESLRYFLWDHIQELRSSCKSSYLYSLKSYGLLKDGVLDQQAFKERLDDIVEQELALFIHHEIGELLETTLDSSHVRSVIGRFPASVLEFVCRAVKDVLADTHPRGVLGHICRERKSSSLGLYVSFLDGLRQELFPEMNNAWKQFHQNHDWRGIESARDRCRGRLLETARDIVDIAEHADGRPDTEIIACFNARVLVPLGLEMPPEAVGAAVVQEN